MRTIEVSEQEAGQRLDRFLRKLLPAVPLGGIFGQLRRGAIRIDGRKATPDLRLAAGMVLTLRVADADLANVCEVGAAPLLPPGLLPTIVHRDDDLLVVDKPAGLAVQPGSGNDACLTTWLDGALRGLRTATFHPAPAHRIDRGTSGLVLIGLSPASARALAAAFRDGAVDKRYLAIVHGSPRPQDGTIEVPLAVRTAASAHEPKVVVDPAGQPARTDYRVRRTANGVGLVELVLHTGRMHQLRAHLAHLGHPIVGDRRYGSRERLAAGVFLLHAHAVSLPHPATAEPVRFEVPPPPAFAARLATR